MRNRKRAKTTRRSLLRTSRSIGTGASIAAEALFQQWSTIDQAERDDEHSDNNTEGNGSETQVTREMYHAVVERLTQSPMRSSCSRRFAPTMPGVHSSRLGNCIANRTIVDSRLNLT